MDEATNKPNTGLLRNLRRYGVRLHVAEDVDDDLDIVREDHVDMAVVGVGRLEGRRHPTSASSQVASSWVSDADS